MGYSSPKKQLDLKEFLAQPGPKTKSRSKWKFSGKPGSNVPESDKSKTGNTSADRSRSSSERKSDAG